MQPQTSHIVFLIPGFATDEADESCLTCLQYYISTLAKIAPDKKISILAFEYPYQRKNYIWKGIPVYSIGGKGRGMFWKLITWYRVISCFHKLHKQNKVSSIQSFWLRECSFIGYLLSTFYGVNFIATAQGQDTLKGNWYLKLFQFFDMKVVCNSQFNAATYYKSTGKKCEAVIPFGVDYESLYGYCHLESIDRTIDIIGVGSLLPVKNYTLFLEIVAELKKEFAALKVLLIGGGPQEILLQQKIISLGLSETVMLTGFIASRKTVLQHLNRSKIFLHTASHEGQCYAFMEAIAFGLDIVSFDVGYLPKSNKSHSCTSKDAMLSQLKNLLKKPFEQHSEPVMQMKDSVNSFLPLLR